MLAGQLEQEQVSAVARLPASLTTPLGVYSLPFFCARLLVPAHFEARLVCEF